MFNNTTHRRIRKLMMMVDCETSTTRYYRKSAVVLDSYNKFQTQTAHLHGSLPISPRV